MKLSLVQKLSIYLVSLNLISISSLVVFKEIQKINGKYGSKLSYRESQLQKQIKKSIIKVAIYRNTAYWVLNNVIYKADIDEYGNINHENAEEIDVFNLSEKEVNNLLTILDNINS